MTEIDGLSNNLKPILAYEMNRGNSIKRVDRPAGTNCPLAVIFVLPLDIEGYKKQFGLPEKVRTWINNDSHYSLEAGYVCDQSHHALAGPITK